MKKNRKTLLNLYKAIKKIISKIDFESIYPGFEPFNFALYDEEYVIFNNKVLPYDHRFVGNTAIYYEKDFIAIWKIDSIYVHYNILASKIIHEMFHAWQYTLKEKRFPDEFIGLSYAYEKYNINLKFDETQALLRAYENEDYIEIEKFKYLRESRRKDYHNELYYEEGIETVEGTAKYIELKVLELIDREAYEEAYQKLKESVKTIKNYLPIRGVSYDIGALMHLVREKFNLKMSFKIVLETKQIFDLIFADIPTKRFEYTESYEDFRFLEEYYRSISERISIVLTNNPKIHRCDQVVGFDPMNSFRVGKYVHYRHFVMIMSGGKQEFIPTESVGEVDDFNRIFVVYQRSF